MIPIDVSPRQAGKTTRALAWLAQDPDHRAVLTPTTTTARHLLHHAQAAHPTAGITARHFIAAGDLAQRRTTPRTGRDVEVYADDADRVLTALIPHRITGASWCAPTDPPIAQWEMDLLAEETQRRSTPTTAQDAGYAHATTPPGAAGDDTNGHALTISALTQAATEARAHAQHLQGTIDRHLADAERLTSQRNTDLDAARQYDASITTLRGGDQ